MGAPAKVKPRIFLYGTRVFGYCFYICTVDLLLIRFNRFLHADFTIYHHSMPEPSLEPEPSLDELYRKRLGISPDAQLPPDGVTLCTLVEKHLGSIPFENLSMHGAHRSDDEPLVPLTLPSLREKILKRNRGGCCFELNGLLGHYLLNLGYPVVRLVPCWVYAGPERGHNARKAKFRTNQTHAFLLVRTAGGESFVADVGLGEPPLHALHYNEDMLNIEQMTPEGMKSRIVREKRTWIDGDGVVRRCLRLEWWRPCQACLCAGEKQRSNKADDSYDIRRLRKEVEKLRSTAEKACRKSNAKQRPPFKVFASYPSVRKDAKHRVMIQKQKKYVDDSKNGNEGSIVTAGEIRHEICQMWAQFSDDERQKYHAMAVAELKDYQEEARSCNKRLIEAENALNDAISNAQENNVDTCTIQCDERCDGNGGYWEPRLQWDITDAPLTPQEDETSFPIDRPLESFQDAVDVITAPQSTFMQKIVACLLTREDKITITGSSFRPTSPRFPPKQSSMTLDSETIRSLLHSRFRIEPMETTNLIVDDNISNQCKLWEHL